MPDIDVLFDLLPEGGEGLRFEAVRAAFEELVHRDVSENELYQLIFALDRRVTWLPEDKWLGRLLHNTVPELPDTIGLERDLEPWVERYLWGGYRSFYDPPPISLSAVIENTARTVAGQGRWTRPDVCMACVSRYRYTPTPQFDLFSFELKMPNGCNMLAVHEALSHGATSHFAYLCLYLPDDAVEVGNLPAMLEQAQRHGVGVIVMQEPRDPSSYVRRLDARRNPSAPAKIDGFVEERFNRANKLALRRWVRT